MLELTSQQSLLQRWWSVTEIGGWTNETVNRNKLYTNLTSIFVTEMVVCHKDRWVKGKRTTYLLHFLIYLQNTNALQNFRILQENFSFGVYNIRKRKERVEGLNPLWTGWGLRYFCVLLGSNSPLNVHNLSKTSELFFAANHMKY